MDFYRPHNTYSGPAWTLNYTVPAHTRQVVQGIGFGVNPMCSPTRFSAKSDIIALVALAIKGDKFITKKGVIHVYDGERWIEQKKVLEPPIYEIRINALVDAMLGYYVHRRNEDST